MRTGDERKPSQRLKILFIPDQVFLLAGGSDWYHHNVFIRNSIPAVGGEDWSAMKMGS